MLNSRMYIDEKGTKLLHQAKPPKNKKGNKKINFPNFGVVDMFCLV